MHFKKRILALLAATAMAAVGCQGERGPAGQNGQNGAPGANGTNGTDGTNGTNGGNGANGANGAPGANGTNGAPGVNSATSGLVVAVQSVTVAPTTNVVSVRFTLKDDQGYPVDLKGKYSVNTTISPRFALARIERDPADNSMLPYAVLTKSGTPATPTALTAPAVGAAATASGQLTENSPGTGDYTYAFPPSAALDATKLTATHTVWMQITRQTDLDDTLNTRTFTAVNKETNFVPSGGGTVDKREIVTTAKCSNCHAGFKPEGLTSNGFHGGGRVEGPFCAICHHPQHGGTLTTSDGTTSAAASMIFVHRIHNAPNLQPANQFHGIADTTFPQDIRNCAACHAGAAQGDQFKTRPSRAACGSCHDYVDFTGSAVVVACQSPVAKDANGLPVPCAHLGGQQTDDTGCTKCHTTDLITNAHLPVAPPDPNSTLAGGTNANTNAAYLAAAGSVPSGASQITYDVKSVQAVVDATVTPNLTRPQITFRLLKDGTPVVFNTFSAGVVTELVDNFIGSPSVYFAWSVPQDNIATPADFNASASGYVKNIWNGSATGTGKGTIAFDATTGYYTITLTGVQIPATAQQLTGGLGYTYALPATQPMTQTNVPGFPFDAVKKTGGLLVPAPNVWKTATGFTARRDIVDNAKCQACHVTLGANPTFHAGQRNDGPTCSFCHNPNKTSSGWAANAKDFIHAAHAGRVRANPFTWHAESATAGMWEITFPSRLNNCEACHKPGTYDFSKNLAAVPNLLVSTAVAGKFDATLATATPYTWSPFFAKTDATTAAVIDYGAVFSFNAGTGVTTPAAATTLVTSPITAACVACHDDPAQRAHMIANGATFYVPRGQATAVEQCLICHGSQPNAIAPIADMHK